MGTKIENKVETIYEDKCEDRYEDKCIQDFKEECTYTTELDCSGGNAAGFNPVPAVPASPANGGFGAPPPPSWSPANNLVEDSYGVPQAPPISTPQCREVKKPLCKRVAVP